MPNKILSIPHNINKGINFAQVRLIIANKNDKSKNNIIQIVCAFPWFTIFVFVIGTLLSYHGSI